MFGKSVVILCLLLCLSAWTFADRAKDVNAQKTYKFFVFTEECFNELLVKQNFFDQACLKQVLTKGLGYAIVVGSGILKIPQIIKILSSRSVEGLSSTMFYTESLAQLLHVCYNVLFGYPFSVYGESVIILFQNFIIIALIWTWAKPGYSLLHMATVVGIAAVSVGVSLFSLPEEYRPFIVIVSISLSSVGRLPQIYSNYAKKNTGQLSVITIFLTFAGSASRVFTSLADVSDLVMASGFLISCLLNLIMFLQIVLYWNSKPASKSTPKPSTSSKTPAAAPAKGKATGNKKKDN